MRIEHSVGKTPLIELKHATSNPNVKVFAKLEGNNPAGSVKDRAAYFMINDALESGKIKAGDTIIEATSGNTGIALALMGQQLGVNVKLLMPENSTEERKQVMRAYGADLILTPSDKTIEFAREQALKIAKEEGYHVLNQFANNNNPLAHFKTTGPEIWEDTNGEITHFVSAMGTTGTIMGVSKFLKSKNPEVQIIGAQPVDGESIPGIRRWTKAFIPEIFEPLRVDSTQEISLKEAVRHANILAKEEGVFAGVSSGGAYSIARKLASELTNGVIVFIACDRGDRYLSSGIFENNGE